MRIKRILNNNSVVYVGKNGKYEIALGKGVGFQKKIGDKIDESLITNVFVSKDEDMIQKTSQLLKDIPLEYIQLGAEITELAKYKLKINLSDILIISLSDHIYGSVQRQKEGLALKNALLWEIKRFYEDEYNIGLSALTMIKQMLDIDLLEDEAGFIAMNIINAEVSEDSDSSMNIITKIIQDICNIVRHFFKIEFDSGSVYYYRFMNHLKFFAERMVKGNVYDDDTDATLLKVLKEKYSNSYMCAEKIRKYLIDVYAYNMSKEEETYLIIHIQRVIYKKENKQI